MFGDDAWISRKIQEIYEIFRTGEERLESIYTADREYIILMAAFINNEYHSFLTSCVEADEDITKIDWECMEECVTDVRKLLRKRARPNIVITGKIKIIADLTREEQIKKQKLEAAFFGNQEGGLHKQQQNQAKGNKFQRNKNGEGGPRDDGLDRETDPDTVNPNVNPDWKMSWREFRRFIAPNVVICPKNGDKSVCEMYTMVGRCHFGARCYHSHDELSEEAKKEIGKWIAECKSKAKGGQEKEGSNKKQKKE
jgi:hypothetical protein